MERMYDPAKASPKFNIVLVEDEDANPELILAELASSGLSLNVTRATKAQEVRAALSDLGDVDAPRNPLRDTSAWLPCASGWRSPGAGGG
jgi:hypothetical protein